jgi:hypothetical protein
MGETQIAIPHSGAATDTRFDALTGRTHHALRSAYEAVVAVPEALAFAVIALIGVTMSAYLVPPMGTPDEHQHYFYSQAVSNGDFLPSQLHTGSVGGVVDQADILLARRMIPIVHRHTAYDQASKRRIGDLAFQGKPVVAHYPGAAAYPPYAYMVPALGNRIARLGGADVSGAFYAGRMANALLFVILGTAAITVAPVGRVFLAVLLTLPMPLMLGGSYSPDSLVIPGTALIAAITATFFFRKPAPRPPAVLALATAVGLVAAVKIPVIALVLPVAALACRRSPALSVACLLIAVAFVLAWAVPVSQKPGIQAWLDTLPWDVSSAKQMAFLASNPFQIPIIAIETMKVHWWNYMEAFVGRLGLLNVRLSPIYVIAAWSSLLGTLGLCFLTKNRGGPERWWFLVAAVVGAALTFAALYLRWTEPGALVVKGVQGRYFLPLATLVPFALFGTRALAGLSVPGVVRGGVVAAFGTVGIVHSAVAVVNAFSA